ncbi:MAG: hypothetical protein PF503_18785 [Desulfobacula sp.]|jgi:chromosome segregation ATPase|nr:hypothetical protein [Desulfobacula sp.]
MEIERKLAKYKREVDSLEKDLIRFKGNLETLFKGLRKKLNDPNSDDEEILVEVKVKIKEAKKEMKKAQDQFLEKMELIDKMAKELEV